MAKKKITSTARFSVRQLRTHISHVFRFVVCVLCVWVSYFCYVSGEMDGNRRATFVGHLCVRATWHVFFVLLFLRFHAAQRDVHAKHMHTYVCVCLCLLARRLSGTSILNGTIVFGVVKSRAAG